MEKHVLHLKVRTVLCAVPPPARKEHYANGRMPTDFPFPFVGSDSERLFSTTTLNKELERLAESKGWEFLAVPGGYADEEGMMLVPDIHIQDNAVYRKVAMRLVW